MLPTIVSRQGSMSISLITPATLLSLAFCSVSIGMRSKQVLSVLSVLSHEMSSSGVASVLGSVLGR